jgi:hypothetical protein
MSPRTETCLNILSLPLGYIISYFCQSGLFRNFVSLGDYLQPMFIAQMLGGEQRLNALGASSATAWIVSLLAVLTVGLICWSQSSKPKT